MYGFTGYGTNAYASQRQEQSTVVNWVKIFLQSGIRMIALWSGNKTIMLQSEDKQINL